MPSFIILRITLGGGMQKFCLRRSQGGGPRGIKYPGCQIETGAPSERNYLPSRRYRLELSFKMFLTDFTNLLINKSSCFLKLCNAEDHPCMCIKYNWPQDPRIHESKIAKVFWEYCHLIARKHPKSLTIWLNVFF